jgi:hypothetical protein
MSLWHKRRFPKFLQDTFYMEVESQKKMFFFLGRAYLRSCEPPKLRKPYCVYRGWRAPYTLYLT